MTLEFIKELKTHEPAVRDKTFAFMSYNPSIGRVLQKMGVKKFEKMAVNICAELKNVSSRKKLINFIKNLWIK